MNALGWAKMGLAQESYDDYMTDDLKNRYKMIIVVLTKLTTNSEDTA